MFGLSSRVLVSPLSKNQGLLLPRILIADDHAVLRRGVRGILSSHSQWQLCGEAETGEEALRAISRLRPDIVIMDVAMPGIGGLKATQTIHEIYPDVKVILFTLYHSVELIRAGFAAGALGFVLKSDAEDELLRALETVSRNEYFVTSSINPNLAPHLKDRAQLKDRDVPRRHTPDVEPSAPHVKKAKI